jgi:hypothetical protein
MISKKGKTTIDNETIMMLAYRNCKIKHENDKSKRDILCALEYNRSYENIQTNGKKWNLKLIREKTLPRNEKERKIKQEEIQSHLIEECLSMKMMGYQSKVDIITSILSYGDYEHFPPIKKLCEYSLNNYFEFEDLRDLYLFPPDTDSLLSMMDDTEEKNRVIFQLLHILLKRDMVMPSRPTMKKTVFLCILKAIYDLKISNTILKMTREHCDLRMKLLSLDLKHYPIRKNAPLQKKQMLLKLKVIALREEDKDDTIGSMFSENKDQISSKIIKLILEKAAEYVNFYCDGNGSGGDDNDDNGDDIYVSETDIEGVLMSFMYNDKNFVFDEAVGFLTGLTFKLQSDITFRKEFELKRSGDTSEITHVMKRPKDFKIKNMPTKKRPLLLMDFNRGKMKGKDIDVENRKLEDDPLYRFVMSNFGNNVKPAEIMTELITLFQAGLYKFADYRKWLMEQVGNYDSWVEVKTVESLAFDLLTSFLHTFEYNKTPPQQQQKPTIAIIPEQMSDDKFSGFEKEMDKVYQTAIKDGGRYIFVDTDQYIADLEDVLKTFTERKVYDNYERFKLIYERMLLISGVFIELTQKDGYDFPLYLIPPLLSLPV